ncbi:hypothetical protein TWF281_006955 [Arthrobotrys megalospora]
MTAPLDDHGSEPQPEDTISFPASSAAEPQTPANLNASITVLLPRRVVGGQDTDPELLALFGRDDTTPFHSTAATVWNKRIVESNIFFRWSVVCPSRLAMIGMRKDPDTYPIIDGWQRPNPDTLPDPHNRFADHRKLCMHCLCDDNGNMMPNPARVRPAQWCKTIHSIEKCKLWFNCWCSVEMLQPEIVPGNSITDYQDTLNNIPFGVKVANTNYEWNLAPQFSMSWQYISGGGDQISGSILALLYPGQRSHITLKARLKSRHGRGLIARY